MATRRVLRDVAPADSDYSPVSSRELIALRSTHGEQVACECLNAELSYRKSLARSPDAATLYRALGSHFKSTNVSELFSSRCSPVRRTASTAVLFPARSSLSVRRDGRLLAQKPSPQTRDCWLASAPLSIRRTKGQRFRGLLPRRTHSSRLTSYPSQCRPPYTRQLKFTQTEGPPINPVPTSRSAVTSSPQAYSPSWDCSTERGNVSGVHWRPSSAARLPLRRQEIRHWLGDHTALQAILDACLRQSAMLDATLGSTMRDWLLTVGRSLSWAAYSGPLSQPH